MERVKCAIIGSGNIGTDLMMKLKDHPTLEMSFMVGIDPASEGLALAKQMGYETTDEGFDVGAQAVQQDDQLLRPPVCGLCRAEARPVEIDADVHGSECPPSPWLRPHALVVVSR